MKKLVLFGLVLVTCSIMLFISCASGGIGGSIKGETTKTEGWIDEDTFRVSAKASAPDRFTKKIQRENAATDAATILAQCKIIEKFVGAQVKGVTGVHDFENSGQAAAKEISAMIAGGSVLSQTCDDEQNCEVVYEVKAKGLKKKVTSGGFKATAR